MAKQNETNLLSWQTREFEDYEKGFGWYLTFFVLILMLIGYQLYLRDYFAALTLFIVALVLFFFARLKPREVEITITPKGIYINNSSVPFASIRHFWIVEHSKAKALHLETTAYLNRFVIIPLSSQNPSNVRELLVQYLPESEPNRETLGQKIARFLKY